MAPSVFRRTSASRSRRGFLPRASLAVAAGLALRAAWSTFSASPGFTVAGPVVLERQGANRADPENTPDDRKSARQNKPTTANKAAFNTTVTPESGLPQHRSQEVTVGPPWATCFVEYEVAGKPAFEEWLMRGEQENLNAFRAWRESGALDGVEPAHMRCTPASAEPLEETECLQCVSHTGTSAPSTAGGQGGEAVATVQGQVVSTFIDLKQCLSETADGKGFCMSGRVVFPA